MLLLLVVAARAWGIGPVLLWSGDTIAPERVASVGPQGIELRMTFEPGESIDDRTLVGWGQVRDIEGGWGEAQRYRAIAEAIHRAEARLARADMHGAGLALEAHAGPYMLTMGPTSSQIASAMVGVHLYGGDRVRAAHAWFATLGGTAGVDRPWIDVQTGLCPALPPVFTREAGAEFLASEAAEHADTVRAAMAELYREAAYVATGNPGDRVQPDARAKADPAVRFVIDMVRAQTETDPSARRAAREALDRRGRAADERHAWIAAWAGLGVGVSMMGEQEVTDRDAGAARLVSVLIEQSQAAPGIAELARELLVDYFESTGRVGHADAVRSMERAALLGLRPWREGSERARPETDGGPTDEENP